MGTGHGEEPGRNEGTVSVLDAETAAQVPGLQLTKSHQVMRSAQVDIMIHELSLSKPDKNQHRSTLPLALKTKHQILNRTDCKWGSWKKFPSFHQKVKVAQSCPTL